MGTEVLRPQDCLVERIRVSPCRRRNYYYHHYGSGNGNGNGNGNFSNPNLYNANRNTKKPAVRSDRSDQKKKQQSEQLSISKKSNSFDDFKFSKNVNNLRYANGNNSNNLTMEKVAILRRGESLDSKIKSSETVSLKKDEFVVASTGRLGPDPNMVPKQTRVVDVGSPVAGKCDMYAGSAFSVSPAPSSLPLPSFSKKKQVSIDDSATRDLRRLLRLDF